MKSKQCDEMVGQLAKFEEKLALEKQLVAEKNNQICALNEALKTKTEEEEKLSKANHHLTSLVQAQEIKPTVLENFPEKGTVEKKEIMLNGSSSVSENKIDSSTLEKLGQLEAEYQAYRETSLIQKNSYEETVSSLHVENASYKEMVENLKIDSQEKILGLQAENASYKEAIDGLKTEFEEKISSLKLENASYKETLEALKSEFEDKISDLKVENSSQKEAKAAFEELVSGLEAKSRLLESTNSGLITELNELTAEMKTRGERISKLETDLAERMRRLDDVIRSEQELKMKLTVAEQEQSKAVEQLTGVSQELASKMEAIEERNRVVTTQAKEIDSLDFELSSCREKMADIEAKVKTTKEASSRLLSELTAKNSELLAERDALQTQVIVVNIELEKRREESAELLEKMREDTEQSRSRWEGAELEVERLKKHLEERERWTAALEAELRLFKQKPEVVVTRSLTEADDEHDLQEFNAKDEKGMTLEAQVATLSDELKTKEAALREVSVKETRLEKDILGMQESISLANGQIAQLTADLSGAVKEKATSDAMLIEAHEKLSHLRTEMESLQMKNEECSRKLVEQENLLETSNKLEVELNSCKEHCIKLQNEVNAKNISILELEAALAEAHKLTAMSAEQAKKTIQELTEANTALANSLDSVKSRCDDLEREAASGLRNLNCSSEHHDDSRSEAMSTSTVSKAEEINRMKDIEDSFEDRYAKLKLIAIKLKKKVADQSKIIEGLESRAKVHPIAAEPELASSQLKDKLTAMTNNFSKLQAEYDEAIDRVEQLEGQNKMLTKDLEASLAESMANKQRAEETGQTAASARTEAAQAAQLLKEKEAEITALAVTVSQEREERQILEERLKQTQELEARLREQIAQGLASEETVSALRLEVEQLELTVSREQERAGRAQESLATTRTNLNQVGGGGARSLCTATGYLLTIPFQSRLKSSSLRTPWNLIIVKRSWKKQWPPWVSQF